ncbi:MAG: hypothetical protein AB7K24_24645 [Gemmataceae bacterium]
MKKYLYCALGLVACAAATVKAADWARPSYPSNCNCQQAAPQTIYPVASPPPQVSQSYYPLVTPPPVTPAYAPPAPATTTCWQRVGYRCANACCPTPATCCPAPATCCPAPVTCYAPVQCCSAPCASKHPILDNIRARCADRKARRAERRAARCCPTTCCYP